MFKNARSEQNIQSKTEDESCSRVAAVYSDDDTIPYSSGMFWS